MKPRGVTTRDEGGERVRGELGFLWRDGEVGGEHGSDGDWSGEEVVPRDERFPSCWRCCCGWREGDEDGVRVAVGLLAGSRLTGRVGVVGAGAEEGAK